MVAIPHHVCRKSAPKLSHHLTEVVVPMGTRQIYGKNEAERQLA